MTNSGLPHPELFALNHAHGAKAMCVSAKWGGRVGGCPAGKLATLKKWSKGRKLGHAGSD